MRTAWSQPNGPQNIFACVGILHFFNENTFFFYVVYMLVEEELDIFQHLLKETKAHSSAVQMVSNRLFFMQVVGHYFNIFGKKFVDNWFASYPRYYYLSLLSLILSSNQQYYDSNEAFAELITQFDSRANSLPEYVIIFIHNIHPKLFLSDK